MIEMFRVMMVVLLVMMVMMVMVMTMTMLTVVVVIMVMVMMVRRLLVTTSGEERGSVAAPCIISSDPVELDVEQSLSTKSSLHLGLTMAASSCPK